MNGVENQQDSPLLIQDLELLRSSGTDACVLISVCECGNAERIARRIHLQSPSPQGRFVGVDCGGPAAILEDELFGRLDGRHDPGACTLFLKEVGRLSTEHQARLLVSLMDSTFASWPERASVRVVACTTEPLLDRVLKGTFDDRLFYRLNVIHLNLREQ